jgi:hypothetical protein
MKTTLKLAVIGALMVMGAAQTKAASVPKTIWTQSLNFTLTAWEDGTAKPAKIGTKDIIGMLNGLTAGGSNALSFSKSAQLLTKQDTTLSNDTQIIVVRDGKPKVDTDVSAFFSVNGGDSVSFTSPNGKSTLKHSITSFTFVGIPTLNATLSGFTTETTTTENGAQVTKTAKADVSGSGTVETGIPAIISGSVMLAGGHLEAP